MTAKEIVRILKADGWIKKAQKGGAVANQLKSGNFLRQKKIFIKEAITV